MEGGIAKLNCMNEREFHEAMHKCCGSARWAEAMALARPFASYQNLCDRSRVIWEGLGPADWKEAFSCHPKIGDLSALRKKFAATADMAFQEQSGVSGASDDVLKRLADGNFEYEKKFGYIFIVCASGKSAQEMLSLLEQRLLNDPQAELKVAAEENLKITSLRLKRLAE